jgi:hypothetical protein
VRILYAPCGFVPFLALQFDFEESAL